MTCNCLKKIFFKEAEEINIKIICENKNLDTFDQCAAPSILKFVYERSFDYLIKKSKDFSTSKKKKYNNKDIMEFSSKPRTFCLFLAMLLSTVQSLPSASPVQTTTSKKSSNQCGVRSWGAPLNNATQLSNFDEDHFRAYPDSFPWVVQLGLSSPQTNSDR